jgi:hypothetical protein
MVSTQALNEFKQIYKEEYGVELDNQTALDKAERLLMLMSAVYRPIKRTSNSYVYGYVKKPKETKTAK